MNWIQKIAQKPMLPDYPPTDVKKRGVDRIDQLMNEETADNLSIQYPDIQYGGAGHFGIAFQTGPQEMSKISADPEEVENATQFFHNKPDWIVPVLHVPEQIQEYPPLWIIRMKKLRTLPPNVRAFIGDMFDNGINDISPIELLVQRHVGQMDLDAMEYIYSSMLYILEQNRGLFHDFHGNNFGIDPDDGMLKMLDVGVTKDPSSSSGAIS